jgi:hypothetical protein
MLPDLLETPIGAFEGKLSLIGCCPECKIYHVRQLSGRRPTPQQWHTMAQRWYKRLIREGREVRLVEYVET